MSCGRLENSSHAGTSFQHSSKLNTPRGKRLSSEMMIALLQLHCSSFSLLFAQLSHPPSMVSVRWMFSAEILVVILYKIIFFICTLFYLKSYMHPKIYSMHLWPNRWPTVGCCLQAHRMMCFTMCEFALT